MAMAMRGVGTVPIQSKTIAVLLLCGCASSSATKEHICDGNDLHELMEDCIEEGRSFRGIATRDLQLKDCDTVNLEGTDDCQIVHSNGCRFICEEPE